MAFEFLKSLAKSTPAEKVEALIESAIFPGYTNEEFLVEQLEALRKDGALGDPAAIAQLATVAHVPMVARALDGIEPALRARALAPVVAHLEQLEPEARSPARAAFGRALMVDPSSLAQLPEAAKTLGEQLLASTGHGRPGVTNEWQSPWELADARPKKARGRHEVPALVAWPDTLHDAAPDEELGVVVSAAEEARALKEWKTDSGEHYAWQLSHMSDATALKLWSTTPASEFSFYDYDLPALVRRFGQQGLEASLRMLEANPASIEAAKSIESPRVAGVMAGGLTGRPALRLTAREWFDRFPEVGAIGLVPAALGRNRAEATRALEGLRHLKRTHAGALSRALARYPADARDAIEELLARGPELPSKKPALPDFADPRALPRPTTPGGAALQGEALGDFVRLLKLTPLDGAEWLSDLRAAFTEASLVTFGRALFNAWTAAGSPPKEKWALHSLAHLADDKLAHELAGLAAELAPRGLSARAQEITEVLAAMQTRTSLKLVHQLSRKVRSKAFRTRAELVFTTAAEKMGLTQDELGERLVPDFGLTPAGVLPVEPRVALVLDGAKAKLVDASGAVVKALPEVKDAELAAELAELKKKASALVREVADRLERRMAGGRTMSLEHFTEVYAMHGVARRVAERLVWGVFGAKLEHTFGFGEAGLIDVEGAAFVAPEGKAIGVVHPLELTPALEAAWKKRLGVKQPFEQLARRATHLASPEALRQSLRGYVNRSLPPGALIGLEKLGWERGPMVGGGCYVSYVRKWPTGVVEVSFAPGIYLGDPRMHGQQVIEAVGVSLREPTPPKVLSETEHDLAGLFD